MSSENTPSQPPVHEAAARSAGVALPPPRVGLLLLAGLLAARAALSLAIDPAWEFHRDEFLYFAMGEHLSLLDMQFPPLLPAIAHAGHLIFGEHVAAARVPALLGGLALMAAVLLWLRRRGAGRSAVVLCALALSAGPVFVRPSVLLHPVVFDQLWCTLAMLALLEAERTGDGRWWLALGAAAGLGALTKFSVALWGTALAMAALFRPAVRRQLGTRWPWCGVLLAALLAVPSLAGQIRHGWPFLEQARVLGASQLQRVATADVLLEQPLMLGGGVLLALAGLWAVRDDAAARTAAVTAAAMLALVLVLRGKSYYTAPVYPALIGCGALALERLSVRRGRMLLLGTTVTVALVGLGLLPVGTPILAPQPMTRYAAALGLAGVTRTNRGDRLDLPQDYADMLGWRALTDSVAAVIRRLPEADRTRTLVYGDNYGEAGALALHGPSRGLPSVISVAGDFHAWGPGEPGRDIVVTVGADSTALAQLFADVRLGGLFEDARMVHEERHLPIYVCRHPRRPLRELWPLLGPRWG